MVEIPLDYLYWTFSVYDIEGNCIGNINMSQYQTVYYGSNIAIIISSNNYLFKQSEEVINKIHYQKYPNRKIYIKNIPVCDDFKIKYENYYDQNIISCQNAVIEEFIFKDVYYNCVKQCSNKRNIYFEEIPKCNCDKIIKSNSKEIKIYHDHQCQFVCSECVINVSEPIKCYSNQEIQIICFDHFTNKCSIYSQIEIINADNNEICETYFTGAISKKINSKNSKIIHEIKYRPSIPLNIIIVEKIFCNHLDHCKKIYPMKAFIN